MIGKKSCVHRVFIEEKESKTVRMITWVEMRYSFFFYSTRLYQRRALTEPDSIFYNDRIIIEKSLVIQ